MEKWACEEKWNCEKIYEAYIRGVNDGRRATECETKRDLKEISEMIKNIPENIKKEWTKKS